MANNHLVNKLFSTFIKIIPKSFCSSHLHRNLCTQSISFSNVYSDQNLSRCLKAMNGLLYHNATEREKKEFFEIEKNKKAKKAAVLIPFCYDGQMRPYILFTLRSPRLAVHKWEVSFPGGKICDLQDEGDVTKTAARETKEELGVDDDSIDVYGVLTPLPGKQSNTFIFPVLAKIDLTKQGDHPIEFHNKCQDEVEEVIIRPLDELIKKDNWSFTHWTTGLTTPIYRDAIFDDRQRPRIWGLSSYVLFQVLTNLMPDHFKLSYKTLTRYKNLTNSVD